MKKSAKLFVRITATTLSLIVLMAMIMTTAFAGGASDNYSYTPSLADFLELGDDEQIEVIVQFDSPSALERRLYANNSYTASYEQKLVDEQNAVLDQFDITPRYRYTSIINAVAITATGEEIRALEKSRGVEAVYLPQLYESHDMEHKLAPHEDMLTEIIGANLLVEEGYTGDGVVVAVIDSGLDLSHEVFNDTKYVNNPTLTPKKLVELGFADKAEYYNEKIPFYYSYIEKTSVEHIDARGHGTVVGSIIGGYAENEDGTVKFSGVAPGAQLCSMQVTDSSGSANQVDVIAALEDAYKLGVDIVNVSLGNTSGFRASDIYLLNFNGLFTVLEEAGITVVCSMGNASGMHEGTPQDSLDGHYSDYGTLSSPAVSSGNIGVASVENLHLFAETLKIGEEEYSFIDRNVDKGLLSFTRRFEGKTVDIVFIDAYGMPEDYEGVDVDGKIVAVHRGGLSFTDMCKNATEAGAAALVVINNESAQMGGMIIENQMIPAIIVEHSIIDLMPISDYVVEVGYGRTENPAAGMISTFSSIGVTPDLEIGVDIAGIGGVVTGAETNTEDGYGVYNGTSMASPSVAGAYALLYEKFIKDGVMEEMSKPEAASFLDGVTQSTASLLINEQGSYYSPRFQGTGLINVPAAASAEAYITNPIISLGYDKSVSGMISMEYELVSNCDSDKQYTVFPSVIIDSFIQKSPSDFRNAMSSAMLTPYSKYIYMISVDGVALESSEFITLPAGEKITVQIDIQIAPRIASLLLSIYPNGYFLDGFVEFYDVNASQTSAMHGSYVSYAGDWLAAPAVEPLTEVYILDWLYENGVPPYEYLHRFSEVHPDVNFHYTAIRIGEGYEYHIGQNPFSAGEYIPSNPDRNAISAPISNADAIVYDSVLLSPSLLRNCKSIEYVVTNSETGEVYARTTQHYVPKDRHLPDGTFYHMSNFTFEPVYLATNEFGEMVKQYIPTGTDVTISIYTLLDHPDATERLEMEFEITVDYVAPEVYYEYDADTKQLTVSCSDGEYLAGIILRDINDEFSVGDRWASRIYADDTPGVMHTEVFDLTDYEYDSIYLSVSDYAGNAIVKALSLVDGDISNMDADLNLDEDTGIELEFESEPYLYQDFDFSVIPSEGYCFTEDFEILINGEAIAPLSVENGVYYYSVTLDDTDITVTATGVMEHNYLPTVTVTPTCVNEGELSHICSNCEQVGGVEMIPAEGHTHGEAVTVVEPTCTAAGFATVSCTECETILATEAIPATSHTPGEFAVAEEATCSESGLKIKTCTVCGEILDSEVIPAKGHTHGEAVTVVEPTCTTEGFATVSCTECETILATEAIPATSHTPGEFAVAEEATCSESGLKIKTCTVCGEILDSEVIPAKRHTQGEAVRAVEPTCTTAGFATVSCTECGVILATETIPATSHAPGDFEIIEEATCSGSGLEVKTCTECGEILDAKVIPAKGHAPGEFAVVEEATCSGSGLETKTCTVCGEILDAKVIPAKGHTHGTPTVTVEATCTESGLEITKCVDCNVIVDTKMLPPLGHDDSSGKAASAVSPAVCGVCGESYGSADSAGLIVTSLVLSSVSVAALIVLAAVVFIKKKK